MGKYKFEISLSNSISIYEIVYSIQKNFEYPICVFLDIVNGTEKLLILDNKIPKLFNLGEKIINIFNKPCTVYLFKDENNDIYIFITKIVLSKLKKMNKMQKMDERYLTLIDKDDSFKIEIDNFTLIEEKLVLN